MNCRLCGAAHNYSVTVQPVPMIPWVIHPCSLIFQSAQWCQLGCRPQELECIRATYVFSIHDVQLLWFHKPPQHHAWLGFTIRLDWAFPPILRCMHALWNLLRVKCTITPAVWSLATCSDFVHLSFSSKESFSNALQRTLKIFLLIGTALQRLDQKSVHQNGRGPSVGFEDPLWAEAEE